MDLRIPIRTRSFFRGSVLKRWRVVHVLGALAFLGGFVLQPAHAEGSVSALGMGTGARNAAEFGRYWAVIKQYNASGERFRIDTMCRSACTMFLKIRNVCVAPGATLAFHAGHTPSSTQSMLSAYNAALRQYLTANRFMNTSEFHTMSGSDMIKRFGYPACR
ncbi:MAG: hypothetical protein KJZ83_23880 [Burkholderiaceae bacterium]|nr:hypothetical protein [Burkholderiaceae bacterium]